MAEPRTLIRVTNGLYRSKSGNLSVSHFPWGREAREKPWLARWLDWMGSPQQRRFRTLNEARKWHKEGK